MATAVAASRRRRSGGLVTLGPQCRLPGRLVARGLLGRLLAGQRLALQLLLALLLLGDRALDVGAQARQVVPLLGEPGLDVVALAVQLALELLLVVPLGVHGGRDRRQLLPALLHRGDRLDVGVAGGLLEAGQRDRVGDAAHLEHLLQAGDRAAHVDGADAVSQQVLDGAEALAGLLQPAGGVALAVQGGLERLVVGVELLDHGLDLVVHVVDRGLDISRLAAQAGDLLRWGLGAGDVDADARQGAHRGGGGAVAQRATPASFPVGGFAPEEDSGYCRGSSGRYTGLGDWGMEGATLPKAWPDDKPRTPQSWANGCGGGQSEAARGRSGGTGSATRRRGGPDDPEGPGNPSGSLWIGGRISSRGLALLWRRRAGSSSGRGSACARRSGRSPRSRRPCWRRRNGRPPAGGRAWAPARRP